MSEWRERASRATRVVRRESVVWAAQSGVLVLLSLVLPERAFAQANFDGAQLGGRSAMMGGAVVASGEDEANAFINPAGITRIPGQSFSFSTFAVGMNNRTMVSSLDATDRLGVESADVNKFRLRIIPNTFCLFLDGPPKDEHSGRSRHKYAVCAAATEREEFDFTRNRTDLESEGVSATGHSTNMKFVRSTVAAAWGLALSRDTSIGVTFRTDNALLRDTTNASAFSSDGAGGRLATVTRSTNAWSWDTSVVIGITSYLSRHVTLGASLTTPSQHLFGSYVGVATTSSTGGGSHTMTQDQGDFRYNHPGSLRMGLAFSWPRLVVEVNGVFYGPQTQLARANFDRTVTTVQGAGSALDDSSGVGDSVRDSIVERGAPVTNLSVGTEYFLKRNFSLVTGLHTDFSGIHPRVSTVPSGMLFRQQKDSFHGGIGLTSYGQAGRLLLGIRGQYSRGTILMADATLQEFVTLPQRDWGLTFVLSGSLSFRAVRDAAARAARPLMQSGDDKAERKRGDK